MKSLILSLVILVSLTGCSLFFEAAGIAHRRSKEIPEGGVVTGHGFTVQAPAGSLYPTQNIPTRGGVTLRPTQSMFEYAYFVAPFSSSSALTPDQALDEWNKRPERRGLQVHVIERKRASAFGKVATRAVVDLSKGTAGQIAAIVVVKRPNDFLILSHGNPYYPPMPRDHAIKLSNAGLDKLIQSTSLTE